MCAGWANSQALRVFPPQVIHQLLSEGTSVALCPGGVRECLYMERGKEVVFLRQRKGFVR